MIKNFFVKLFTRLFKKDAVIKIVKCHPDAILPTYATPGSAGFDLYAVEDVALMPGHCRLIKTGLKMKIPEGYELQIRPRSGMALKTSFRVANSPGTVDSDYIGEICIIGESSRYFEVKKGRRVAQGVLCPVKKGVFKEVKTLKKSSRGEGGFGSSGK